MDDGQRIDGWMVGKYKEGRSSSLAFRTRPSIFLFNKHLLRSDLVPGPV